MAAVHLANAVGGNLFLGFISAVAFATILAVVAGLTLAGASAVSHDLYANVFKKGATEREELRVSKITVLILGVIAIILGVLFENQNIAFMDRFMLVEMGYPKAEVERELLNRMFPEIPAEVTEKMVDFANDVRRNFMGNSSAQDALEVTLSTRTLMRWAKLTIAFQPLSKQGISPIMYALDRALGFRASTTSRAALHEMAQRIFPSISN